MHKELRLNLLDKMPTDATGLCDGVTGRALAVAVIVGVNVGRGDAKLGFDTVAFAAPIKSAVVIEPNAPLGQLQPMTIGASPFRHWGESTILPDNFEFGKQSRPEARISLPEE